MELGRAKLLLLAGTALLVPHCVAMAADYPMQPPPPPQQYYPPQPVYQPPPPPMYQPPPVYQPPPQPIYQPPPPPPQYYQPPPVYTPPPVYYPPQPIYQPPPPPVIAPPTPVVYQNNYNYQGNAGLDCCSNWYLRGDIGMSNQKVDHLDNALFAGSDVRFINMGFDSGMILGVGIGYEISKWFRADFTAEYRGKTAFRGLDVYTGGVNDYYGSKSEWLYLLNVYADLGTWWCFTPFVGVGVGAAKITIWDFRDNNIPNDGVAFGYDNSKWNMAWAFHAGVGYEVSRNLMLEFSYRYVHLGDGESGDLTTYLGQNSVKNPMIFKDITSQDIRLGFRWKFDCCEVTPPPPPPVVYQPPPPPPPLMRRG